jgi:hypothetical protein
MLKVTFTSTASFGLIADGNIYIDPNVAELDGFYYSAKVIDTCNDGNGHSLSTGLTLDQCAQQRLNVLGNLMGFGFSLNRTCSSTSPVHCDSNPATQQVETVTLPGQLYTKIPPAFSDSDVQQLAPNYSGEQSPRF